MPDLVSVDAPALGVAVITLRRPAKYNALSSALLADLTDAVDSLDSTTRAVVLTGADPAFCAGVDLVEIGEGSTSFGSNALDPVRTLPIPVIGAVNGVAVTGGLELALACDFRIASERARFADTHARVGLVPGWGLTARLPQAVGQSWARQMSFTGDFIDADLALRIGLVNEVVAHEDLLPRAVALATSMTETAPGTTARIREIYALGRDGTGSDSLAAEIESVGDTVAMEDPDAFAARRAAVFERGRSH